MTTATKIRLRFAKRDAMRLVSHNDLMRCLERLARRAELPVARSQGFNPRPRIVFPLALALGIEGRREVVELELDAAITPEEVLSRLSAKAPPGLSFDEVEAPEPGRCPQVTSATYRLDLPENRVAAARAAMAELLAADSRPYVRRRTDRATEIDLRRFVLSAEIDDPGVLRLRLMIDPGGSARPEEILETLGLHDLLSLGAVLIRSDVELAP